MRGITKSQEPVSLMAHRQTAYGDYYNYGPKDDLRHALVREQRGLCCYCMGRIRSERASMKIEHWKCRARYPGEQLKYQNLLGACLGNAGPPAHEQHCDTRKRDRDLKWNPADRTHHIETRVRYHLDGSIHADDTDFDGQLNGVLNLNLGVLKNHRKGVYDALGQWWRSQRKRGRVPRQRLERQKARHDPQFGDLAPYVQVAVWLLEQKLAGMAE